MIWPTSAGDEIDKFAQHFASLLLFRFALFFNQHFARTLLEPIVHERNETI